MLSFEKTKEYVDIVLTSPQRAHLQINMPEFFESVDKYLQGLNLTTDQLGILASVFTKRALEQSILKNKLSDKQKQKLGITANLKKEEIFKIISSTHKDENTQTLKEVAYNLALASTTTSNLETRAARAIEKLRNLEKPHAPLSQAAIKQESNTISICPICKFKMKTVKLLEDRNAFYCTDHKIVVPFPAIDEYEADL